MQENAAQAPLTLHLSNLNMSDDMVDQRTLPEGEEEEEQDDNELIVLDPEHVCWFSFNIYSKTIY